MDEDNPDPRQVARMLRAVTKMSGEVVPEQVEEMMRRLEEGENLDKLDDEFGAAADELGSGSGEESEGGEDLKRLKERLRAARRRPARDPVLYEMSEFVGPSEDLAKPRVRRTARSPKK